MTEATQALLPVTHEDRELAIALFEAGLLKSPLGASAPDDMVIARWRKGILGEGDNALQVIAHHRISHSLPGDVGMREVCIDVVAHLAAAISLLEAGGKAAKKAAPSDKMFYQMLRDYKRSLNKARAALTPSATISEPMEPVAYMRRWAFDGDEGTRGNRPRGWKLHAVTRAKVLPDDVPLFATPSALSGDAGEGPDWIYDIQWGPEGQQDYAHVLDRDGNLIAVMKTHHAALVAKHRGALPSHQGAGE